MVKIGFTGDFCPRLRIEELLKQGNWQAAFSSVLPFFHENDRNLVDLECPLLEQGKKIKKTGPHLKSLPETVEILKYLKVGTVCTANNHFKDYGREGMEKTYDILEKANIDWVGSGLSFEQASNSVIKEINNVSFAFINATENEWSTTEGPEPGCNPLDPVNIYNQIQEVRGKVEFVVLILHGGHEHYNLPSPRMKKWYRYFIDIGADAVVGHHSHIISGYEIYRNKPIFFSLGNFCIDWENLHNEPWNKGLLLRLIFEKNTPIKFEFKFINQNGDRPGLYGLDNESTQMQINYMESLNKIIMDDEKLEKSFVEYSLSLKSLMNTWIQPYKGKILPGLT